METTSKTSDRRVRFNPFELDLSTRELHRNGQRLKLHGHPIDVLAILLERPGELVTREELQKRLWPQGTFVDFEQILNNSIRMLREALGDKADTPRFIETLPRLGYRFIAPVEKPDPDPTPGTRAQSHTWTRRLAAVAAPLTTHWISATAIGAALAIAATLYALNVAGLRGRTFGNTAPPHIESIAVLPLENLSGDPEQKYLADGMTEELITDLGRSSSLRVISRTSVMRYEGTRKSLPEIARELHVDAIVEGTVLRSGNKVRITANLLHAPTDRHLWAASYERDMRDVLTLQDEIATAIANQVRIKLTPRELQRRAGARPVNLEAYEDYLKGRFQWYKISKRGLDAAERYYQLALEKDPNYALAYAGLASVWTGRTDSGQQPVSEVIPKAMSAILKALDLDPNLSEAHVVLANIHFEYKRDWTSAEEEFRRAIELNPNNRDAHFMYADYLISLKRNQEWQTEMQKALALDPVSSFTRTFYGWHLVYLGRCDEAIKVLQEALESQPDFASAHMGLWGAYFKKQMDAQAIEEAVRFFQAINDKEAVAALNAGYRQAGYREGMKRAADVLALRAQRIHVPGIRIARLYAHAGDTDRAIRWLQKAYEAQEGPLIHLDVAWDWDSLRSDPRFQNLIRRMNFPP